MKLSREGDITTVVFDGPEIITVLNALYNESFETQHGKACYRLWTAMMTAYFGEKP